MCIACISNVNQLGSSSHCDAMARHLRGNRKGFFSCNLWIFKMPISSSQMLEINRGSQTRGFSVSRSPKATFVIVLLALYGVSRTFDTENTTSLNEDLLIHNRSVCLHHFSCLYNDNPTVYVHAKSCI